MLVLPQSHAVATAYAAFEENGTLKDAAAQQAVADVVGALVQVAGALAAAK